MKLLQLKPWIRAAPKVFVWVRLSETQAAYLQVSKRTIEEYLSNCPDSNEEIFVEFGEESEIFLGFGD